MSLLRRIWSPLCQRHPLYGHISLNHSQRSLACTAHPSNKISLLQIPRISTIGHSLSSINHQVDFTRYFCRRFCSSSACDRQYLLSRTGQFGLMYSQRCFRSTLHSQSRQKNRSVLLYVVSGVILVIGFSYAAVPLYTLFCQATGLGGEVQVGHDSEKVGTMTRVASRPIKVRFNADLAASMRWNFKPQQTEITVYPGETALAFYSAINPTDKPIIGISTYNVVPFDAGQYFNKIQCFCFEEQRLNPHEQVDMPVFFFIDPEFVEDPKMCKVDTIILSYTFFEAKEGLVLPDPFARR